MDCKDYERQIPNFINQKLDYPTLRKFCKHIETCDNCKEELTIQFLVAEGLQRMEEGESFDLQKELYHRLDEANKRIDLHHKMMNVGVAVELTGIFAMLGIVVGLMIL